MKLRRKLNVSMLELAAESGLMEKYLSQLEEGVVQPLTNDLKRIEKALRKISADAGRSDKEPPDPDDPKKFEEWGGLY